MRFESLVVLGFTAQVDIFGLVLVVLVDQTRPSVSQRFLGRLGVGALVVRLENIRVIVLLDDLGSSNGRSRLDRVLFVGGLVSGLRVQLDLGLVLVVALGATAIVLHQ